MATNSEQKRLLVQEVLLQYIIGTSGTQKIVVIVYQNNHIKNHIIERNTI